MREPSFRVARTSFSRQLCQESLRLTYYTCRCHNTSGAQRGKIGSVQFLKSAFCVAIRVRFRVTQLSNLQCLSPEWSMRCDGTQNIGLTPRSTSCWYPSHAFSWRCLQAAWVYLLYPINSSQFLEILTTYPMTSVHIMCAFNSTSRWLKVHWTAFLGLHIGWKECCGYVC